MTLVIALTLACGIAIGANASSALKEISAYLNYGITVQYNGQAQTMNDANGDRVYPISYNGTTYLPVRAVSDMLDIAVDWDGATQTVILSDTESAAPSAPADNKPDSAGSTDLIESFEPYSEYSRKIGYNISLIPEFLQSGDQQSNSIGGEKVDHWFALRINRNELSDKHYPASFNLGGRYGTLTFKAYADKDTTLVVKGDNDKVLGTYSLTGGQIPQSFTVDLGNTSQLTFVHERVDGEKYYGDSENYTRLYVFDAVLS